ncbi:chromate transporter [Neobacillus sp. FSL H8-0543]|uniref:chromate transporter n=1 Tax=Neobacillus sp. FSL H8-0543 TaxID=2954672 RepID=UPI003158877D
MMYLQLYWGFFLVGCFSFGGGYAMLPLIERLISSHDWMTSGQFAEVISLSGMLPGSIGTNAAVFVGFQTGGIAASLVATAGIITPSLILVVLISKFFKRFQDSEIIEKAFYGLRPVVVGLLVYSAIKYAFSLEIMTTISIETIIFTIMLIISLLLLIYKKIHPLFLIFLSVIGGIAFL